MSTTLFVAGTDATASLLNQVYTNSDTTQTSVTAATATTLTTSYNIPANEAQVGSAYEIRFGGSGTWGATQQGLTFTLTVGGTSTLGNTVIGPQAFAANASFRFSGIGTIVWNATGVSGNFFSTLMVNLSETANNVAPPAAYSQANWQAAASYGIADSTGAASGATDTTTAEAFVIKAAWQSTTGAPTLTNRLTIWRKVG